MQIDAMASVWLRIGSEIVVRDTWEGRLHFSHERLRSGAGISAVASAIRKVGI